VRRTRVRTGGNQYFDLPNNRTAMLNSDNSGVVSLFSTGFAYSIDSTSTCQSKCPIGTHMARFTLGGPNFTYMGDTTYNGVPVQDWRQFQRPLFNISFQQTDWYLTTSATPMPVGQVVILTPFGVPMGMQTQTFENFQVGPPPASAFTVNGLDTCPTASKKQCEGGSSSSGGDVEEADAEAEPSTPLAQVMRYLKQVPPLGHPEPSAFVMEAYLRSK
jgi:hypothetical protein